MRIKQSAAAGVAVLSLLLGFGASSASAETVGTEETITVGGREFGENDGLEEDTIQVEIVPGEGADIGVYFPTTPESGSVTPRMAWGASYATSTERLQLWYDGKAKAAANVFSGKRIIQVCIWYSRGGVLVGNKVCSNATSNGRSWSAGSEAKVTVADTLDWSAPKTIFNIKTSRINPQVL